MPFDVFKLRDEVVGDYKDYFSSFINIYDGDIQEFVKKKLDEGELWPDAELQLNPAFEPARDLDELAEAGIIRPETARFFGRSQIRLHQHQQETLEIARRDEPYVVSTGTGSGKSLTYLLPIVDHVMRNPHGHQGVQAVIIYPMNALVNSQLKALERYRDENWPDCPLRFEQYTGQTSREKRNEIIANPPHILLTNYVMLEYLLIRPDERTLLNQATRDLRFLVLDELHVYRGRQGADVGMLLRRVRQRAGEELQVIGTSATIATGGDRNQRLQAIADVGSQLFGVEVPAENVVDETLRRITLVEPPADRDALRRAVESPPPAATEEAIQQDELAAWVERTFGIEEEGPERRLIRRKPISYAEGLRRLVADTGLSTEVCDQRLRETLDAGNRARTRTGDPVFAFRLHQFLSSGGTIFSTIEEQDDRMLRTEGQYLAPSGGTDGGDESRVLYPLSFCRSCGQEYYLVQMSGAERGNRLEPQSPMPFAAAEEGATVGYFAIEYDNLWSGEQEDLPDFWFEQRARGPRVRKAYEAHVPSPLWVRPDGTFDSVETDGAVQGWYQPRPFLLCLRCRAAYDKRGNELRKLATLSQTGRSTATTTLTAASIIEMHRSNEEDPSANKVLSFTDNRQDASLQAGHLNDFVQVAMLRGALARSVAERGELELHEIGPEIFRALDLNYEDYMREPVPSGLAYRRAKETMIDLLQYRALEDLRRDDWVSQPNLEQVGLLSIDYAGLDDVVDDESLWVEAGPMAGTDPEKRREVLTAILNNLRGRFCIEVSILSEDFRKGLVWRSSERLSEYWRIEDDRQLRRETIALLPGSERPAREDPRNFISLGRQSAIGRYLAEPRTWGVQDRLSGDEVEDLVRRIVDALTGHVFGVERSRGEAYGVRILADTLVWRPGDGVAPGPDPIRARALYLRRPEAVKTTPNAYFRTLYSDDAEQLTGIRGGEHTGQVSRKNRIEREDRFINGDLTALYCSPTMELGVDISDLSVVHMRNMPPTPANYAQRSGRAGRGGQPALVLAFASQGNAHDQYFFQRREAMIAGAVAPARMDLANRELVASHIHSLWLARTGIRLGRHMQEVLELEEENYPLKPEIAAKTELSAADHSALLDEARSIIRAAERTSGKTFVEGFVERTVDEAAQEFDAAFGQWRDLYKTAIRQRREANALWERPNVTRQEQDRADQRSKQASREMRLLRNEGSQEEADFYPYRYLASAGFLPGYNFPRLPLRVMIGSGEQAQTIDRPRFLGLTEFGPQNMIYHEGRKYQVSGIVPPAGGIEERLQSAKICNACGAIYPGNATHSVEICSQCRTRLDGARTSLPQRLLEQPTSRAMPRQRITAEEEERVRQGFRVTTHVEYPAGVRVERAIVRGADDTELLEITYAPQTELWRINHGWLGSDQKEDGFLLEPDEGRWLARDRDLDAAGRGTNTTPPISGVKPYVTDRRNVLLIRPLIESGDRASFITTLAYALQRGLQFTYQVEEQEVAVELIGEDEHQRILIWEAAEGGTGISEQLMADSTAFAQIAFNALDVCHYDAETGEQKPGIEEQCSAACYECLLSYSNQPRHRLIDRRLVHDTLWALAKSCLVAQAGTADGESHYQGLLHQIDPASTFERRVLELLYQKGYRLPDHGQYRPTDEIAVQVDFYYKREGRKGVCVFVDGPSHDHPEQAQYDRQVRAELDDLGFRVVAIRYDSPIEAQFENYEDVFQ